MPRSSTVGQPGFISVSGTNLGIKLIGPTSSKTFLCLLGFSLLYDKGSDRLRRIYAFWKAMNIEDNLIKLPIGSLSEGCMAERFN